ncbi:MAG: uroporphyrinogen-III C-methyltransferase [Halothiobacillaceae bacterium]
MTDTPTINTDSPATEPASIKPPRTRKGSAWFVWVLLFLLLLAGGAGYLGFAQWQQQQQAITKLHGEIATLKQSLNEQLAKQQSSSRETINRLSTDTQATQQSLQLAVAGLQATLEDHKQQLASLKNMLGQDASQWRLSEIERLLAAAQLRVGALDDPIGARQMLREVERLAASLGGEAQAFRTAVQRLAGALDASVPLDRDGLALKMFNLAHMMPNLPLKSGEVAGFAADSPNGTTEQASWWAQTKAWFGSWLTVKNTAQPAIIMPSAERPAPLTEAAQTLLQARTALLTRHVDEAARLSAQALMQAQQATGLDSASPKVQQTLAELREIAAALEQGYRPQALDFAPAFVALRALNQPVVVPEAAHDTNPSLDVPAAPTPPQTKE